MTTFIFDSYDYDATTGKAVFHYKSEEPDYRYTETIELTSTADYDQEVFERALFLAFMLIGVSYYKSFPGQTVRCSFELDDWQADFFSTVYQEGLSQFAFENQLARDDLAQFAATVKTQKAPVSYSGEGIVALQSGGKDSLLTAQILEENGQSFDSLYVANGTSYPNILDGLGDRLRLVTRTLDITHIRQAIEDGGKNGHVPVTFIVLAIGLLQTVLDGKRMLIAAIGHEGEEPHTWIGDMPVNHQWSKTWQAEQLFAHYVRHYISPNIAVGSLLRGYSELKIAQLFVDYGWERFGHAFSSCNRANYQQGADNTHLSWCGNCPKCANSYLLFAPFIPAKELQQLFGGVDLFTKEALAETFKGLLGIDGAMKPFECVGEIDELRVAYQLARQRPGYAALPFDVPASNFDYTLMYPHQAFVGKLTTMIQ